MLTEAQIQGLGQFSRWGFTLDHPDDHFLILLHEGEIVARFSQTGATEANIQEECARHLVEHHGWDGILWNSKKGGKIR